MRGIIGWMVESWEYDSCFMTQCYRSQEDSGCIFKLWAVSNFRTNNYLGWRLVVSIQYPVVSSSAAASIYSTSDYSPQQDFLSQMRMDIYNSLDTTLPTSPNKVSHGIDHMFWLSLSPSRLTLHVHFLALGYGVWIWLSLSKWKHLWFCILFYSIRSNAMALASIQYLVSWY